MGAEEGIIYADCDLELSVATKLRHDFAGHYNRPDIFQLWVNERRPQLYNPYLPEEPGGALLDTSSEPPASEQ
jgi:aliphatic nitrilase